MLKVTGLSSGYGDLVILRGVDLEVQAGEFVGIIGSNAAGKSTLVRAMVGLLPRLKGRVEFDRTDVSQMPPYAIAGRGMAVVLEHSAIARLSVQENLILGAYRSAARLDLARGLDRVLAMFPILASRRKQAAGSLSGGEQQMLCIARALMSKPKLLVLDEPSVGLSPVMVSTILKALADLNRQGLAILLVEQNVAQTLRYVSRAYVLENGSIMYHAPTAQLVDNPRIREAYLGM